MEYLTKQMFYEKKILVIIICLFSAVKTFACDCLHPWDNSFNVTAKNSDFVALVKVLSFDKYLSEESSKVISESGERVPYLMTVEITKKYKGQENRGKIRIWGDYGASCRPYLTDFKIGSYYLIAPKSFDDDYEFFACNTDFLRVDINQNKAVGEYSIFFHKINLTTFELDLKYGRWALLIIILLPILIFFIRKKYFKIKK